ncbi:MAG TPA: hypothetical protein DDX29_10085, partial [Clostridiales bacterium]|nr:hypothetical protein [Clostridiales bacterium]
MKNLYQRGSEWRKWDLHVHTSSSYNSKYRSNDSDELLVKAWRDNNIAAVAITDHFIIDKNRIENLKKIATDITVFPGVELRTDKGNTNIHLILIFKNDINLKELEEDFNAIMLREKAIASESNDTIHWSFDDIIEFGKKRKAIITIHAGSKSEGIEKITNSIPAAEALKSDVGCKVDMFEIGQIKDIEDYKKNVFQFIDPKPLIMCSDNHDPRKYSLKENLWIKADPTFDGLIQCIYQPEERVFVGNIPIKLDKSIKNKQTYIESILVKKVESPKNTVDNWFDFDIPINSGLTTIIGNKGSGKSALSDIIGHFCQSQAIRHASFLHAERFRNSPKNLANDYEGAIRWLDSQIDDMKTLG